MTFTFVQHSHLDYFSQQRLIRFHNEDVLFYTPNEQNYEKVLTIS